MARTNFAVTCDMDTISAMFRSERDSRRLCGRKSAMKRSNAEMTEDIYRAAEHSSPERKKMKICKRLSVKRPFSQVSQEETRDPEMSAPDRKRRRIIKDSEEIVQPSTSKNLKRTVISLKGSKRCVVTTGVTNIWIIGDSYIRRGEEAAKHIYTKNLGLNANIQWFGKGGLCWGGAIARFNAEVANHSPPDVLVVHAGGNDLGLMSPNKLTFLMQKDLKRLRAEFPSMHIVFSCISERQNWRYGKAVQVNKDRKTVNHFMKKNVEYIGGELVEHPSIKFYNKKQFLPDGVHLTSAGNQVFLTNITSTLERILRKSSSQQRV